VDGERRALACDCVELIHERPFHELPPQPREPIPKGTADGLGLGLPRQACERLGDFRVERFPLYTGEDFSQADVSRTRAG